MRSNKIETTIGGKKFILKFGFGLVDYISNKENINFGNFFKKISEEPLWGYKIIFHSIRYYELCSDTETIWSDAKLWDLIDIESENFSKINKIIDSFVKSFPQI